MRRVIVNNSVTLDGVMQAPGRPDEDRRDGFEHGGWAQPYFDDVIMREATKGMAGPGAMLFGRRTYEDFASIWPKRPADDPFAKSLNRSEKYVVSNSLRSPLEWEHSTLLEGDAPDAVRRLKAEDGPDLVILGSGQLIRSLLPHGLIDQLRLLIHPLVLGSGQHLFDSDGTLEKLRLVDSKPSTTGVILATYEPAW